jgi:proline iminopeptidase
MRQIRNFVMRLSIDYVVLSILLVLAGWGIKQRQLFGVWIAALVYTLLTVTVRRFLLALSLSLIVMTGGLFIFVVDGVILALTAALTGLNVVSAWWIVWGVLVMSVANVWVEKAFRAIGWLRLDNQADAEPEVNVLTARSTSWWRRLVLIAILLGGIVFSAAMAAQVFLAVGQLTRNMAAIAAAAGVAFAFFVYGIAWLVAEGLALDRRAVFATLVALPATALVVVPVTVQLFAAVPDLPDASPEPRAGTAYWELPTGSRIAYSAFPARGGTERNPIVYLHGGLGWAVLDTDIAFFRRFADSGSASGLGFDVYLYDMVGTGLSDRLEDVREYTLARHVRDLEAIRETIGADRLILVAHAEGAEVAIRYMIAHRDRVERVVFYSPTPMWDDQRYLESSLRTAAGLMPSDAVPGLRQTVALALGLYSPRTAAAYVSQDEMTSWADRYTDEGAMVCAEDRGLAPDPRSPGYNPYVGLMGDITDDVKPDPRKALREVFVPTILIRGECDPVHWGVVQQYWEAVPNLYVYYVEDAGSMLHLSQPERVHALLRAFLNEEPMPQTPLSDRAIRKGQPTIDAGVFA